MSDTQNFKNHTRTDPAFHFVLLPILAANVLFSGYIFYKYYRMDGHPHLHLVTWGVIMSIALMLLAFKARTYPLHAQDRIIRLEERLRLTALGVPAATVYALTESQLVGLRFASDAEAPALAQTAATQKLDRKQIKEAIKTWRADNFRV